MINQSGSARDDDADLMGDDMTGDAREDMQTALDADEDDLDNAA